jgi:hypothetical protein
MHSTRSLTTKSETASKKSGAQGEKSSHYTLYEPNTMLGKKAPLKGPQKQNKKPKKQKSLSAHVKSGIEHGAKFAWDWAWRHMFGDVTSRVRELSSNLKAAEKADWFSVKDSKDSKSIKSDTTKLLELDLATVRQLVSRAYPGMKTARITLSIPFQLTATVTSGIVSTVVGVRPGNSGEFSSLAALFNEYKCLSGEIHFVNMIRSTYTIGSSAATLNTSMLVLAYDTSSGALASVIAGTEFSQHGLYPNSYQSPVTATFERHKTFQFKVPDGIVLADNSYTSGNWAPTSSAAIDFGQVKAYSVGAEVVAQDVVSGVMRLNCEFRMRE